MAKHAAPFTTGQIVCKVMSPKSRYLVRSLWSKDKVIVRSTELDEGPLPITDLALSPDQSPSDFGIIRAPGCTERVTHPTHLNPHQP